MNKRRRMAGVLLLALSLPLSGCWDRMELNEVSIVVGLGIDQIGDNYHVSVQIVNPVEVSSKGSGGTKLAPVVTLEQEGSTVPEALRRMTVLTPRRLQFSHLRMVIFGEKTARIGLRKPLDYLSRYAEMRNDFYLVVAKHRKACDILKVYSVMDPIPANNLYTKLQNSDEQWAATSKMTLNELLLDMSTDGKSAFMTGIEIVGRNSNGLNSRNHEQISPSINLEYSGTAMFDRDRMVGWLDEDGTKAINYVHDAVKRTVGYIPCRDSGYFSTELFNIQSKTRVQAKGKELAIHVYVRIEQDIGDVECDMDMAQRSTIDWLDKASSDKVRKLIEKAVASSKTKLGVDIFGFGQQVHRQHPKIWHQIKDWNEEFKHVPVYVHAEVYTRRIGTIQQSITKQTEKG